MTAFIFLKVIYCCQENSACTYGPLISCITCQKEIPFSQMKLHRESCDEYEVTKHMFHIHGLFYTAVHSIDVNFVNFKYIFTGVSQTRRRELLRRN